MAGSAATATPDAEEQHMASTLALVTHAVEKGKPFTLDQLMSNEQINRAVGGDRKKVHMAIYGQLRKQEQAGTPAKDCLWVKDGDSLKYMGEPMPMRAGRARKATKATKKRGTGLATARQRQPQQPQRQRALPDQPSGWVTVGSDPHGHTLLCDEEGQLYVATPFREHMSTS